MTEALARRRWSVLFALLLWPLASCQVGRAMIATPSDYAEYRRIRVAPTLDERLAAAAYYLEHQADGVYAERVRAYFERAEPVFWSVRHQTEAGLRAYLRALPTGPHASEALSELTDLRARRRLARARTVSGAELAERLDAERRQARQAGELTVTWLRMLVDPHLWSAPLSAAPGSFLVAYRLELPEPVCERDEGERVFHCTKVMERTFPVVRGDEVMNRAVQLWLDLEVGDDWRLRRARLLGPDLFVRRAEALSRRPLPQDDPTSRRQALEAFERRLMEVLSEPALDCVPLDSTLGLALRCGQLRVVIRRGDGREDDEIRIEPDGAVGATEGEAAPKQSAPGSGDLVEPGLAGEPE